MNTFEPMLDLRRINGGKAVWCSLDRIAGAVMAALIVVSPLWAQEETGDDLSYDHFIDSNRPIKCLYGYVAEKTGDHKAAIAIFEDCIERWNNVYSMIWLAQMYEAGVAVERNLAYSTALMKRGAEANDPAGYSSLAKYHYGVALYQGKGVVMDRLEALRWLQKAYDEGIIEAGVFLKGKVQEIE